MQHEAWRAMDQALPLAHDRVELILASTGDWLARIEWLRQLLSPDERAQADAFCFQEKRAQSTISRGLLRVVLGRYLDVAPAEIKFIYSDTGKPALDSTQSAMPLRFNVSHSGNRLLIAVALSRAVGVDIERVREVDDLPALARTVIAPEDMPRFFQMDKAQQQLMLFVAWTRAEALAKASGVGIFSRSAHRVSDPFIVQSLHMPSGYQAAVAVEGDGWHINHWRSSPNDVGPRSKTLIKFLRLLN